MLAEHTPNQAFKGDVAVKSVKTKTGGKGPALSGYVGDRSASVRFVMWQASKQDVDLFLNQEAVAISGTMGVYEGKPQVTVETVREAPDPDWSSLLERSPRPIDEMHGELEKMIEAHVSPAALRAAVKTLVGMSAFKMSPAASGIHHAYIGGLLEHTLGVVMLAERMAPPDMEREAIVAGAALHDLGKTQEYTMTGKIRPVGKTLGHALLGLQTWARTSAEFGVEEGLSRRVEHIIASHHGRREWGAIVEPQTVEAWIVHFSDMLDSRMFIEAANISDIS